MAIPICGGWAIWPWNLTMSMLRLKCTFLVANHFKHLRKKRCFFRLISKIYCLSVYFMFIVFHKPIVFRIFTILVAYLNTLRWRGIQVSSRVTWCCQNFRKWNVSLHICTISGYCSTSSSWKHQFKHRFYQREGSIGSVLSSHFIWALQNLSASENPMFFIIGCALWAHPEKQEFSCRLLSQQTGGNGRLVVRRETRARNDSHMIMAADWAWCSCMWFVFPTKSHGRTDCALNNIQRLP